MGLRATRCILAIFGIAVWIATTSGISRAAEFDKFGFQEVGAELSSHESGAHADFGTSLRLKTDPSSPGGEIPYAALKDVIVKVPPGLIGNLNSVDECSAPQFLTGKFEEQEGCPFSAQVGIEELHLFSVEPGIYSKSPIFLIDGGESDGVARLGFFANTVPVFIDVYLRSNSDYGVTAEAKNLSAAAFVIEAKTTLWGVPADSSHDNLRFTPKENFEGKQESASHPAGHPLAPFLTNPTSCTGPSEVGIEADSYQEPGHFVKGSAPLGEITGCEGLDFEPQLSIEATSHEAAAPSGADATLTIPQHEEWDERATSALKDAIIKLPQGLSINAGAADGLEACSEAQVGAQVFPPPLAHCPDASKIASAVIDSPSLTRPIHGAVYQRTSEPGHLFRAWLVADELGVHLKIPGEFALDKQTGQITSLFLDSPQVPLRELKLHFKGGSRGVLATPRSCGTYQTQFTLAPWSGNPATEGTTEMSFDANCAAGGFSPNLRAGTADPTAGAFSPLVTELTQASGEENLVRLSITMPPGLLAKLKGVELCPDSVAVSGNCPAASRVGRTTVASGFGPTPLWIPQPGRKPTSVFLAGPYERAPYSLVVDTPAQAGPFDLGDVVVRAALQVDPSTAQVTAISDPLPQLIEGVPVSYRDLRVDLDRPGFVINPTSCDPMQITGSATSSAGHSAPLFSRFQVGGCGALKFKPGLSLKLKGGTSRASHPALTAVLRMPHGGANIAWNRVTLPKSLQIDNAHINNPCTRVQFDAHACPKKSILGTATATTPLLDQPLKGPVYFRSNGGERQLPDLVADLHGAIHVVLVGYIDAKGARIRTTFAQVPDAPVSRFKLRLLGAGRGLLTANRDLCASPQRAIVQFNGQNAKVSDSRQTLKIAGCKSGKG